MLLLGKNEAVWLIAMWHASDKRITWDYLHRNYPHLIALDQLCFGGLFLTASDMYAYT
jgi:hypothetical protein